MPKIKVKDFKNYGFSHELVVENDVALLAFVNVPGQEVLFHVTQVGSNQFTVCQTLEKAVETFNRYLDGDIPYEFRKK